MGYNLYITKGDFFDDDKPKIDVSEFLEILRNDNCFSIIRCTNNEFNNVEDGVIEVIFDSAKGKTILIYSFSSGTIRSKGPEEDAVRKMIKIADKLNAFVQGEEGEIYRANDQGIEYILKDKT